MEVFKINSLEVASELADLRVLEHFNYVKEDIYFEDMDGIITYRDDAQDVFNDYYNQYLTLLTDLKED